MTVELLNVDCMEYMAKCEDNAFDLAIVDPPYGIGDKFKGGKSGDINLNEVVDKGWDTIPSPEYFAELFRVSKNQIIWGGNYFTDRMPFASRGWIVWNKIQRNFSLGDGELAWSSFDKLFRIFDMSRGEASSNNKVRIHPTQKPVKLYDWLLTNYAEKGQRILDTHLGSGSSAIAAHYFGVDFVGCELDKDYYDAACQRFDEQTKQKAMF